MLVSGLVSVNCVSVQMGCFLYCLCSIIVIVFVRLKGEYKIIFVEKKNAGTFLSFHK